MIQKENAAEAKLLAMAKKEVADDLYSPYLVRKRTRIFDEDTDDAIKEAVMCAKKRPCKDTGLPPRTPLRQSNRILRFSYKQFQRITNNAASCTPA